MTEAEIGFTVIRIFDAIERDDEAVAKRALRDLIENTLIDLHKVAVAVKQIADKQVG